MSLHKVQHNTLHYITLHSATCHCTCTLLALCHYAELHYLDSTTLSYTTRQLQLHHSTLVYPTLQYATLVSPPHMRPQPGYTHCTKPPLQLHCSYDYSCATPHYIQQFQVTTSTIATTPKNTAPTTFQTSGFALPSVIHTNQTFL